MNGTVHGHDEKAADIAHTESYTVEPLSGCDHAGKDYVVDVRYIVNGLLDVEKMFAGVYDLIENKWQHLGGRLHKNPTGHLELHIPKSFDENCPPVLFDAYDADETTPLSTCFNRLPYVERDEYGQHASSFQKVMLMTPEAKSLFKLLSPHSRRARSCMSSAFGPVRLNLEELCKSGGPLLTVILYRFPHSNETVVRICYAHVTVDANGMGDFVRAWSSSVNHGDLDAVPQLLPLRDLPPRILSYPQARASSYGEADEPPAPQASGNRKKLPDGLYAQSPFNLILAALGILWRNVLLPLVHFRPPRRLRRITTWVPQKQLNSWRDEAMRARPANMPSESFLSDNDLILSWAVSTMAQKRRSWLNGVVSIMVPFNLRAADPELASALQIDDKQQSKTKAVQNAGKVLLHNSLSALVLKGLSWKTLGTGSRWTVAWTLRQQINSTRTPAGLRHQVELIAALNNMETKSDGDLVLAEGAQSTPMLFPPYHEMFITTNWIQSGAMEAVDFHGAVRNSGGDGRASDMWVPSEREERKDFDPSDMFPMVFVCHKRPGKGVLIGLNVDEDLVQQGVFGSVVDLSKNVKRDHE